MAFKLTGEAFRNIGRGLKDGIGNGIIMKPGKAVVGAVKSVGSAVYDTIRVPGIMLREEPVGGRSYYDNTGAALKQTWSGIKETVTSLISGVGNIAEGGLKLLPAAVHDVVDGVGKGVRRVVRGGDAN